MIKSIGGHFVLPLERLIEKHDGSNNSDIEVPKDNIKGDEAEAIMIILFSQTNSTEELQKLHDEIGHKVKYL